MGKHAGAGAGERRPARGRPASAACSPWSRRPARGPSRRPRPAAPNSSTRSSAACADRVSFHSSASRTTSPCSSSSDHAVLLTTDGDRGDAVEEAVAVASCEARHQWRGWTSVPSGWEARPVRTTSPVSASQTRTLQDWVERVDPGDEGPVGSCVLRRHQASSQVMTTFPDAPAAATAYASSASASPKRWVTMRSGCSPQRASRSSSSAM